MGAECNAVEDEISQLNRTQAMIREESSQLKQVNHAAKDKVATAAAALRQAQVLLEIVNEFDIEQG